MQEAEAVALRARQRDPVFPRGLEQLKGPGEIGLEELRRTADRTIDVALGSKVNDSARSVFGQNPL